MTVLEVLQLTTAYFKKRDIESPRLNAEHLLAHTLQRKRIDLSQAEPITQADPDAVLDLDEALTILAGEDPEAAAVAKLRIFAGLSVEEAAQALSTSRANAYRQWAYARAWLLRSLGGADALA